MQGRWALIVVLAFGLSPAPAVAAPADLGATHAYIEANYALAQASVARIGTAQAKIERLNGTLARDCPGIGGGSPEDEASQPVSHAVVAALWSLAYGTDAGPIRTFVASTKHLRWSNPAITHTVARYARSLHEMATLPLPDLCAIVSAWKASGFQVVPPTALSLVSHVEAIELTRVPARLLSPYVRGSDRARLARTMSLETKLEENEFVVGQTDWLQLLGTLGLNE